MAEQRYEAVMEVMRDRFTVTQVAARYGVSRQSVHSWIARYKLEGVSGLSDRSSRPHSNPHRIDASIEAEIVRVRIAHPHWGPRMLGHELRLAGIEPCPSQATIYRALVRNGLVQPRKRARARSDYIRWERSTPMALWQLDVVGRVKVKSGNEHRVVTGIDDHSRFCVIARVVERATSKRVCEAFTDALATYGVPDQILTDNGRVFSARKVSPTTDVAFDRI